MKLPQFVVLVGNKLRESGDKLRELGDKLRDIGNKVREFDNKLREFTLKFPPKYNYQYNRALHAGGVRRLLIQYPYDYD